MELEILYRRAVDGDSRSENELFRRLSVSFRVIAQRKVWDEYEAEEVVQDALLTVAQRYKSIDIDSSVAGWAYRVISNKIMDYVKSKKTARGSAKVRTLIENDMSSLQPDHMLKSRLLICLRKVGKANIRFARILNLSHQGYPTEEICTKLGVERSNFYVILSRARSMLELCLTKGDVR